MFAVLALLFLVVPFVELFLLIQVGPAVGAVPTILGLMLVSVVGAWLVKRENTGSATTGAGAGARGTYRARRWLKGC